MRNYKVIANCFARVAGNTGCQRFGLSVIFSVLLSLMGASLANAQTWQAVNGVPAGVYPGLSLLLTDGSVMTQNSGTSDWYKLTPDNTGSYVNGTWTKLASMPAGYAPLYFASAVLKDGKVIVEGGEYNGTSTTPADTNLGAIYDPVLDQWTPVAPPTGWLGVGDAQSVVLPDGTFMMAHFNDFPSAVLNESTLTWTIIPAGDKADFNNEEGWTLLPDGTVLTVDVNSTFDPMGTELYIPATQTWISAGDTPLPLPDAADHEIGPAILLPNGKVFATGGTDNTGTQTGHTAFYTPAATVGSAGTWTAGPDLPNFESMADAPAALLTNGHVLLEASPGYTNIPAAFYEFDGTAFNPVPAPGNSAAYSSYPGKMLELPSGQILYADQSGDFYVYTAAGTYQAAWQPTITTFPSTVAKGTDYQINGTQFNGLSQGAMYGDDAQMASNYPLVRITNVATGHIFYARTHDHSTMGVATGNTPVFTNFTANPATELGPSVLQVVANGIPSNTVNITVVDTPVSISVTAPSDAILAGNNVQFTATATYTGGTTSDVTSQVTWATSNGAAATISTGGLATGVGAGSTNISASLQGVTSNLFMLSVTNPLVTVAITAPTASLAQGTTEQFTATGTYHNGATANITSQVTWASSNTAAATINASGVALGVGAGSAKISASLQGITSNSFALTVTGGTTTFPTVVSYSALFNNESFNLVGSTRNRLPWQVSGIRVVFSEPITTGSLSSLSGVTATSLSGLGTNTLTWKFAALANGSFATALSGSGAGALTDSGGGALNSGAGFAQTFKILIGDFNDDGVVTAADAVDVNNASAGTYNIFADLNGDGVNNTSDVQIVRSHLGSSLP